MPDRRLTHGMRATRPRRRARAAEAFQVAVARARARPRLEEAAWDCAHRHPLTEDDGTRWCGLCGATLPQVDVLPRIHSKEEETHD